MVYVETVLANLAVWSSPLSASALSQADAVGLDVAPVHHDSDATVRLFEQNGLKLGVSAPLDTTRARWVKSVCKSRIAILRSVYLEVSSIPRKM